MSIERKIKATTTRGISALINQGATGMYAAGNGLYLRVRSKGSASWVFRYTLNSKAKNMGIGSTDDLPYTEATAKAVKLRALLSRGIDPIEHNQAQERLATAKKITFDMVAADYIATQRHDWTNEKHAQQWENTLKTYVSPTIGHLPPSEITTEHILAILTPIWNTKAETASRVRNRIEIILNAAKARKLRTGENIAAWRGHLELLLSKQNNRKKQHHTALPWQQISEFWQALAPSTDAGGQALKLAILSGLRTSEVLGAHWSEFDLPNAIWTIPAERMKTSLEHRVPLSTLALKELEAIPRAASGLLFEGQKEGRPVSNMTMLLKIRRMDKAKFDNDGKGWRDKNGNTVVTHGFRSTFRDWAAENTGFANIVVEQALAHTIGNAVEAAYRRGDLLERRRELMEAWAQYIIQQATGNIISIRKAALI